jgi:hypothetical protein
MHSSGHTGIQARGILTMTALKGKGEMALFLNKDPGKRTGKLSFISLDDLLRLGMLCKTMYLTEPAADTDFFFYINTFHGINQLPTVVEIVMSY